MSSLIMKQGQAAQDCFYLLLAALGIGEHFFSLTYIDGNNSPPDS
uniref:Uncharacterized protein n=1 Tax=Anguilla anguilla TaxID=7936 RepID=A0A0E9PWW2_ANGAN